MSSLLVSRPRVWEQDPLWQCIAIGERVAAALLVLLLSPLIAGLALAIFLLSGRSPLIAHRRVGQYHSELWVYKFRSMWQPGARSWKLRSLWSVEYIDDEVGPCFKDPDDPRVGSRFARFCRQHSLDELPQLLHTVSGRMSLVGPRPATRGELDVLYGAQADEILAAKPGLAGLWQVSGRNRLTIEERRRLDLRCARNRSVRLYFWILARTIPEVLSGGNSW